MKRKSIRLLSAALVLLMLSLPLMGLASCGKEAVMTLGGVKITADLYEYWMGAYKAKLVSSYKDVEDTEAYWSSMINDTQTAEEYLTEMVDTLIRHKLLCCYLFDASGFTLTDKQREEINDYMDMLVSNYTENGKKGEFNDYCEQFGIDYDGVRNMLIMEYKTESLGELLYGEKGKSPVTPEMYDSYYKDQYVRIKEIWINTEFKYVTDEDGNRVTDEEGYYETADLTDEEKAAAEAKAAELEEAMKSVTTDKEFETLMDKYSDFAMSKEYPNGMYLSTGTTYIDKVITAAMELDVGGMTNVTSGYGRHFIRAYPLEDKAYEDKANEDFFGNFGDQAVNYYLEKTLSAYTDQIEINTELKAMYTISRVKLNRYYFW